MKNFTSIGSTFIFVFFVFSSFLAQAQLKTDGPFQVSTGEYRMEAVVDVDILKDRKTEIWARVFWPKNKIDGTIPSQLPLVAFLHGNHGTCGTGTNPRIDDGDEYTDTGECPSGSVVTPNHEGYNYIAEQLASYGYIVISINANRGITAGEGVIGDGGLNLARGRLILKHLELWNKWSTEGYAPTTLESDENSFIGKVNLSRVGLFGHSRGGEGVRAAYNLYYDLGSVWPEKIPQLKIEAIFEIGAVDGQTNRVLDAQNTVWNQLIPICDGDVSDFDGIRPFNRMVQSAGQSDSEQKSIYLVYGANHNFFNTEWQDNDSSGCRYHNPLWNKDDWKSQKQQDIGRKVVTEFFRANVGISKLKKLNNALNPVNAVDPLISSITPIERDFSPNPNLDTQLRFDDFLTTTTDIVREATSDITFTVQKGVNSLAGHLNLNWKKTQPQDEPIMKLHLNQAVDISKMETLDFRFSLPGGRALKAPVNFSISFVDETGVESHSVLLSDYVLKSFNPFYATLFQTVRIPVKQFTGINLTQLKTIQFKLITPDEGNIYLAHIRFSSIASEPMFFDIRSSVLPLNLKLRVKAPHVLNENKGTVTHTAELNHIAQVKIIPQTDESDAKVAITFASLAPFKIRSSLPILVIGDQVFKVSRIKNFKGISQITFYVSLTDLDMIKTTQNEIKITYKGNSLEEWIFNNTLNE